jgi:hypothetical protein
MFDNPFQAGAVLGTIGAKSEADLGVWRSKKSSPDHLFQKSVFYVKWNGVKTRMGKSLVRFVFSPGALTSVKTSANCRTS